MWERLSNSLMRDQYQWIKVKVYPAKRLEDPSQHVLCDVEVERSHIQTHGTSTSLLEVIGTSSCPVFLCLQTMKEEKKKKKTYSHYQM